MDFTLKFKGPVTKCQTCDYSQIMDTERERTVYCHNMSKFVGPLRECSAFRAQDSMDKWEMEQKAWILEVKKTKIIGFMSPEDRRQKGGNGD